MVVVLIVVAVVEAIVEAIVEAVVEAVVGAVVEAVPQSYFVVMVVVDFASARSDAISIKWAEIRAAAGD